jgi:hypothetical protein
MAQPLAPMIAGADMDASFSGDATSRTRQAQEQSGQNPMRQCPCALGEPRVGEVVQGAPTALTPVAFQAWSVVVRTPGTNGLALTTGTLKRSLLPPQGTEVGLASVSAKELVYV